MQSPLRIATSICGVAVEKRDGAFDSVEETLTGTS
jgi:hypothetical protein